MITRVTTLALFITRNLFRTLLGVLPPALTLLVYRLTFTYRNQGDLAYFTAIGGLGLMFVCVITALLVADRANRAAMYPLLARLPNRMELLVAVVVSTIIITIAMAVLYTTLVLGFQHMTLTPVELLFIAPCWLGEFIFAAALGLMMSKLASRGGSYAIVFAVLGTMAFVHEWGVRSVPSGESSWLMNGITLVIHPITATLMTSLQTDPIFVLPALGLTIAYATALFALATALFQRKDVLWAE